MLCKLECNKQLPTNKSSSKSVKCNQPRDKEGVWIRWTGTVEWNGME